MEIGKQFHGQLGRSLNDEVWALLGKSDRSKDDNRRMVHTAHASHYHWLQAGTPVNEQRGEWLISHVYAELGLANAALRHAQRCAELTETNRDQLEDFDLAYSAEALARAHAIAGHRDEAQALRERARELGDQINGPEDKKIFDGDLAAGNWAGVDGRQGSDERGFGPTMIRECRPEEIASILEVINDAAAAYQGVIPADRWKQPYMPEDELRDEMVGGVVFWGYYGDGQLAGVMGIQDVGDVTLIRHAYVRTERRQTGIGGRLLERLKEKSTLPYLVGTWAAATWAIDFYEKHGFRRLSPEETVRVLNKYWSIPDRQIETSVVLADERWPQPSVPASGSEGT